MRRSIILLVTCVSVLVPSVGRAAQPVRAIDVVNNAYAPRAAVALSGDKILWTLKGGGGTVENPGHTISAYAGATFDSGNLPLQANQTYETTITYGAGSHDILYRCKIHSTIDSVGVCNGMCGRLTDQPPALPVPSILSPGNNTTYSTNVVPLQISVPGNMVQAKLLDNGVAIAQFDLKDIYSGTYSNFVAKQFPLVNGVHHLSALSVHADGFYTEQSAVITVTVNGADTQPPIIKIDSPRPQLSGAPALIFNPMSITGSATDDIAVKSVEVTVTDVSSGARYTAVTTCTRCETKSATYSASLVLTPGRYTIAAVARDMVDNGGPCMKSTAEVRTHCDIATRDVIVAI